MFAAASGARLARRHEKPAVKKQTSTSHIEGLQHNYKSFQQRTKPDGPNLGPHAARNARELALLEQTNSRIPKLDFEVCFSIFYFFISLLLSVFDEFLVCFVDERMWY